MKDWQVRDRGIRVNVGRFPFRGLARAHTLGETTGLVKVITDSQTHQILGVHILGPHASDLIHEAALAVRLRARAEDLADLVHAHPTLSETIAEAAESTIGHPIHALKQREAIS
jgi:dihydrolipoamide dehydrogenase